MPESGKAEGGGNRLIKASEMEWVGGKEFSVKRGSKPV